MPLSAVKILELNKKYNLIEGLSDRELNNPEGCGIDLRVGRVERIIGDSFLGADNTSRERYSPKTKTIGDIKEDGNKLIVMKPGDYYLVQTMETISSPKEKIKYDDNLPARFLMPVVYPRVSLQIGCVSWHGTKTDPGYTGTLTFGIKNQGEHDFKFELGARMFNIVFHEVYGEIERVYSGQHQGDRITSQGETEIQN
ncbi:hypothetical protein GOV13_05005 [Candidatus Pacearchaeota archaeon]|nr:hypothetical protein [Candidatus Pacearchaeota archaeon]